MHGLLSLRSLCACGLRRTLPRPADALGKVLRTPTLSLGRIVAAPAFHTNANTAKHTSSEKEDIALEATKNLSTYRGFMFDMDGVLQRWCVAKHASRRQRIGPDCACSGVPIDGAGAFLQRLRQLQIPCVRLQHVSRSASRPRQTLRRELKCEVEGYVRADFCCGRLESKQIILVSAA